MRQRPINPYSKILSYSRIPKCDQVKQVRLRSMVYRYRLPGNSHVRTRVAEWPLEACTLTKLLLNDLQRTGMPLLVPKRREGSVCVAEIRRICRPSLDSYAIPGTTMILLTTFPRTDIGVRYGCWGTCNLVTRCWRRLVKRHSIPGDCVNHEEQRKVARAYYFP